MTKIILESYTDDLDIKLGKASKEGILRARYIAEMNEDVTGYELLETFIDLAVGFGYARETMEKAIEEYER